MPSKSKPGRPKVTDRPDVVSLLVSAFRDGLTVRQACIQSGISHEAFYKRCRDDQEFADKMYYAQQDVMITARRTVIKAIRSGDIKASQWWLEKHSFEKQTEETPVESPAPISGSDIYAEIRKFEQEVHDYQAEFPRGIGN